MTVLAGPTHLHRSHYRKRPGRRVRPEGSIGVCHLWRFVSDQYWKMVEKFDVCPSVCFPAGLPDRRGQT